MTILDLEKQALQFIVESDTPCTVDEVIEALPASDKVSQGVVRMLLSRGLIRLTLDWRVTASLDTSQEENVAHPPTNPLSDAANAIRTAIRPLDIDDAFLVVKRVYDEMCNGQIVKLQKEVAELRTRVDTIEKQAK